MRLAWVGTARSGKSGVRYAHHAVVVVAGVVLLTLSGPAFAASPWSEGAGFRSAEVQPQVGGKAGFTLMDPKATGVWFTNELRGDDLLTNAVALNGAGLAIGDIDGDLLPDLYLCNLEGPNRLYRNLGSWRFAEMDAGEAACAGQLSSGAAFADVDGDGDLDLLVNGTAAGTRLFLNDGKGRWTEAKTGLSRAASATSLALADIDGDGDLDLYCTHYIDVMHLADPTTRFALGKRDGKWEVTKVNGESTRLPRWKDRFEALPDGKVRELAEADGLYRNDGKGGFTSILNEPGIFSNAEGASIPPYRDWGLSVMFRDLNGDGAPDLYICNDMPSPDRVWLNAGRGTFRLLPRFTLRHTSRSSMGVDFGDINRDGHDDIFVVDMLARDHRKRMTQLVRDSPDLQASETIEEEPSFNRNMLFLGQPDGSYAEIAFLAGVAASDWSWCPIFIDVDLDGYEDLLISNGFEFDVMDQDSNDQIRTGKLTREQLKRSRQFHPRWSTANAAFRNRGDLTFEPMDQRWGFAHAGVSYGMALGDLDGDGDLDVVVNNLNDVVSLYRNDAGAGRIAVRLKGSPPNTEGIGARLRLISGSLTQAQEMICGGRYLSGDQALRVFAAHPSFGKPLRLEVRWRNGQETVINDVQPNRIYEVSQAGATSRPPVAPGPPPAPLFAEVNPLLGHLHMEESFDDWGRQPLLPRRLSRLGPGISWYDIDRDGWEDLVVTSGRGGKLAVYTNDHGKQFRRLEATPAASGDQGAVLGWPDGKGQHHLLVAVSNYELAPDQDSQLEAYSLQNLAMPQRWPAGPVCPGPLALADVDNDGDLDLFVGGRFRPGRYPEPVSSALWTNEQGQLRPSPSLSQSFSSLGLVSGATFADLDGDGDPDLALALEWGPVRVFRNDQGHYKDMTQAWGLADALGWWTGIVAGDFDGDGRLDLAAGNWGRNSTYELSSPGSPTQLRLFYEDWNADGNLELVEAWQNAGKWFPVRNRTWLARGLPELQPLFPTHEAFGKATVPEILRAHYETAKSVQATSLESAIFLNRGARFERIALPMSAQVTPVFSINVGDCNGDGIEDLFLSQNFFGSGSDMSRDDSGTALWLQGRGDGQFVALPANLTGIKVHGEQRGAALADFDHDGRVDLAVSQNRAPTRLYVNRGAKRGLRVVLEGPATNPDAVGAQMRVQYTSGRAGPTRAIQAGSGYWSQDGAAQVLGLAETPAALWIRWPGGREQTVRLTENLWDVRVTFANESK